MAERKRIGVPISGLDTSTPDHSVVDGKCETLHNLRYTGEAWRNVNWFEDKNNKASHITYKHPVSPENRYIKVEKNTLQEPNVKLYQIKGTDPINNQEVECYIDKPFNDSGEELSGGYLQYSDGNHWGYILSADTKEGTIYYESLSDTPRLLWQIICNFAIGETFISKELFFQMGTNGLPRIGSEVFQMQNGALVCYGKLIEFENNLLTFSDNEGTRFTSVTNLETATIRVIGFPFEATIIPNSGNATDDNLYYYLFPREMPQKGDVVLEIHEDRGSYGYNYLFFITLHTYLHHLKTILHLFSNLTLQIW